MRNILKNAGCVIFKIFFGWFPFIIVVFGCVRVVILIGMARAKA